MKNLPIELVGAVAENTSSTSDLLAFRSLNSTCHRLVTPYAFGKVHISNSLRSAQNVRSILGSPSLATHVREVVYDHRDHAQFYLIPTEEFDHEEELADLEDVLTEVFCGLPDFRNLKSVVLNFWPSFRSGCGTEIQEPTFWFTDRQTIILHAVHLALKSSSIRSLTLNNIILMSPTCYDFVASVKDSPLQYFSMSVISNLELGAWSGSKTLNGSLSSLLPTSGVNLKSLVLRSPRGLYHSPNTQLRSYYYPALETLVLENVAFDPTLSVDGIEEFILRHKRSLRRLELRSCSSFAPSAMTPLRRWSQIWRRLAEELVSLTEIVVDDASQGYALLDDTDGYIPHPVHPVTDQEDEALFLQFSSRVNVQVGLD